MAWLSTPDGDTLRIVRILHMPNQTTLFIAWHPTQASLYKTVLHAHYLNAPLHSQLTISQEQALARQAERITRTVITDSDSRSYVSPPPGMQWHIGKNAVA